MAASAAAMFVYTVWPDQGEPYVVEATMRDVLAWEFATPKGHKARKVEDLGSPSAADTFELAWHASTRSGKYSGPLTDFRVSRDVAGGDRLTPEPADDEEAAEVETSLDPTRPAR